MGVPAWFNFSSVRDDEEGEIFDGWFCANQLPRLVQFEVVPDSPIAARKRFVKRIRHIAPFPGFSQNVARNLLFECAIFQIQMLQAVAM